MNQLSALLDIMQRPALFAAAPCSLWNDRHISQQMLAAHLDPESEGASRNHVFIDRSAAWITSLAAPPAGKRLLDLGCGPGLYTGRFCRAGFTVYGIDMSHHSIAYAQNHTDKQINYRCGDYLKVEFPQKIDLTTMIYCDFGVLPQAARELLLAKVFAALKPGGIMVFDVFTPRQYAKMTETSQITEYDDGGFWSPERHLLLERRLAYREDHTYLHQAAVLTQHKLKYFHIWEHVFARSELKQALRRAGFAEIRLFGDIAGAPDSPHGKTLCAVARK